MPQNHQHPLVLAGQRRDLFLGVQEDYRILLRNRPQIDLLRPEHLSAGLIPVLFGPERSSKFCIDAGEDGRYNAVRNPAALATRLPQAVKVEGDHARVSAL